MKSALLAILCRPAEIVGRAVLPPHIAVWGIDSGARHSNAGGSDYAAVRAGTFMCRRMIREFYRRPSEDDDSTLEFLTDVPPRAFDSPEFAERLPPEGVAVDGGVFSRRFPDGHGDDVTAVDPHRRYQVTAPGAHPFANTIVFVVSQRRFARPRVLTPRGGRTARAARRADASVARVVRSRGTREPRDGSDRRVGGERGWMHAGAEITGGGRGGTVCVLGRAGEEENAPFETSRTRSRRK